MSALFVLANLAAWATVPWAIRVTRRQERDARLARLSAQGQALSAALRTFTNVGISTGELRSSTARIVGNRYE